MKLTIIALVLLSAIASSNANMITIQKLTDRMNYYRKYPKKLSSYIKSNFLGAGNMNCSTGVHAKWRLRFKEKCGAINACISRLNKLKAVGALKIDEGLTKMSKEHSDYQVRVKKMTHTGQSGRASLSDRVKLNNKFASWIAENIIDSDANHSPNADRIIAMWAIDDGVSSRGHFYNMFSSKYNTWGVGIKPWKSGSTKKERITTFFAATASCCTKCPFSASARRNFYWSGIRASSLTKKC